MLARGWVVSGAVCGSGVPNGNNAVERAQAHQADHAAIHSEQRKRQRNPDNPQSLHAAGHCRIQGQAWPKMQCWGRVFLHSKRAKLAAVTIKVDTDRPP